LSNRLMEEFKYPDYTQPLDIFLADVDKVIQRCIDKEQPVPLPPMELSMQTVDMILGNLLNCKNCDALCCKSSKATVSFGIVNHIAISDQEAVNIKQRLPYQKCVEFKQHYIEKDFEFTDHMIHGGYLTYPCLFLDTNYLCSIYTYRPLVCKVFPLQEFTFLVDNEKVTTYSVNSTCPQAPNLIKKIYENLHKQISNMKLKETSVNNHRH